PIPLHPPLRYLRHGEPPFSQENRSASGRLCPPGRCTRRSYSHTASSRASQGFVYIMVAYCPHADASETMPSSLRAPGVTLTARLSCFCFHQAYGEESIAVNTLSELHAVTMTQCRPSTPTPRSRRRASHLRALLLSTRAPSAR